MSVFLRRNLTLTLSESYALDSLVEGKLLMLREESHTPTSLSI